MSKFRMEFYNDVSGVQFDVSWRDEREFKLAQSFLGELLGGPISRSDRSPDKPEFYMIETEAQRDALFEFQRKVRGRR